MYGKRLKRACKRQIPFRATIYLFMGASDAGIPALLLFALFMARRSSRIALRFAEALLGVVAAAFSPVLNWRSVRSTPAFASARLVLDMVPGLGGSLRFFGEVEASGRTTSDFASARVVFDAVPGFGGSLRFFGGVEASGRTISDLTSARVAGAAGVCATVKPAVASKAVINNDVVVVFIFEFLKNCRGVPQNLAVVCKILRGRIKQTPLRNDTLRA